MSDLRKANHYSKAVQAHRLVDIAIDPDAAEKGYLARLLFHTMMPHSAQEAREWSRKNGKISLYMQAGPRTSLPYGVYPRLVFAWIVTEAYRTKSRKLVLGDSLSDFMDQLGLSPTGGRWGSITQLREQMQRLFAARIMAYRDEDGAGEIGMAMQFANRWELWWTPRQPDQRELWESTVTLGEDFYQEITRLRVRGLYPDRTGTSAVHFFEHRVRKELPFPIARVQTDRGGEFVAEPFVKLLRRLRVKLRPKRPRAPHLNGKVERSQQTDLVEFYALEVTGKGKQRRARDREGLAEHLAAWQRFYNEERAHSSLGGRTPWERWEEVRALTPTRAELDALYDPAREPQRVRRGRRRWVTTRK